tara:strand:+ start:1009 stop:1803 length:795 start_codon:yes stop_codon:yes gene_type:complete
MAKESEADTKQSNLFSSIGALVGMVAGGPGGAAIGGGLGSLLGGGSFQDAIGAGIGSFAQGSFGNAGMAMNALNSFGSGGASGSPNQQGANIMSMLSGQEGQQMAAKQAMLGGFQGGPTGAIRGILQAAGVEDAQGRTDPILGGMLQQMLYNQRKPQFENVMSGTELAQYNSGERRPDYTGTAVPNTPRVMTRAMGGMIDGPGTGTSDSIPAQIYQNGGPVQEARLSDGEFVMTADAVRGAGGGNRNAGAAKMYQMMNQLERVA